jgi:hypothetical protein
MNPKTLNLAFFLILFLNVEAQHRVNVMEGFERLKTGNLLVDRYRVYGIPIGIQLLAAPLSFMEGFIYSETSTQKGPFTAHC